MFNEPTSLDDCPRPLRASELARSISQAQYAPTCLICLQAPIVRSAIRTSQIILRSKGCAGSSGRSRPARAAESGCKTAVAGASGSRYKCRPGLRLLRVQRGG